MSVPIEKIRKGDRVIATSKTTPEVHEVEVHAVGPESSGNYVFSTSGLYFYTSSWTFEVKARPMPTRVGLYGFSTSPATRKPLLATNGKWYWIDFTGRKTDEVVKEVNDLDQFAEYYANTLQLEFDYNGREVKA